MWIGRQAMPWVAGAAQVHSGQGGPALAGVDWSLLSRIWEDVTGLGCLAKVSVRRRVIIRGLAIRTRKPRSFFGQSGPTPDSCPIRARAGSLPVERLDRPRLVYLETSPLEASRSLPGLDGPGVPAGWSGRP